MAKKDNIASVLAFEKKLVPSDGFLYGVSWHENRRTAQAEPLKLQEKSVRGTISNRLKAAVKNDPAKLNAEVEKANLQTVDHCALSPQHDTVKLSFTLKVLGGVEEPSACNNALFKASYQRAVTEYIQTHGFDEIAKRYAINIANGRFLWRNRVGAEKIDVYVTPDIDGVNETWKFDAKSYPLSDFDTEDEQINTLTKYISNALSKKIPYLLLRVEAYALIGAAQEAYPSEELVLDKGKGNKSKILYQNNGIAALHSQKIGNALRTIDTWYPEFDQSQVGAIAIEPYGSVTNLGRAFRSPKEKKDFYTLFDDFARGEKLPSVEDEHYVMAVLVRGGVFGESDKG